MPQRTATINSLPEAFGMVKAMRTRRYRRARQLCAPRP